MILHIGIQYNIKESIGIELSKERHQCAIDLKNKCAPNQNNIKFYCKSFLDHDLSNATVIYMDNTCYPHPIMEQIYEKLPKGCLILYKKLFSPEFIPYSEQNEIKDLVNRTYSQTNIAWIVKK